MEHIQLLINCYGSVIVRLIVTIGMLIALASCAHKIVHVDMASAHFKVKSSIISRSLEDVPGPISIDYVRDMRPEQKLLGKFQNITIYGDNFSQWIASRFKEMQTFPASRQADLTAIRLNAAVTKAYIRLLPSTLGSSLVMDVNFSCGSGNENHHIYRGDSTTMNWNYGQSEVMGLLNEAASKIMVDLLQDMRTQCLCINSRPQGFIHC